MLLPQMCISKDYYKKYTYGILQHKYEGKLKEAIGQPLIFLVQRKIETRSKHRNRQLHYINTVEKMLQVQPNKSPGFNIACFFVLLFFNVIPLFLVYK